MIIIQDYDEPLEVASKITTAVRLDTSKDTPLEGLAKALTGNNSKTERMYSLEEIKEIADYLAVYYFSHVEGD
jgi:hypothetical protein